MASSGVQHALQSVVQSLQWTYSLLWQLCPRPGVLLWAEGHYNGAIKTRKTVQPAAGEAVGVEEAAAHRSRQLRELYESLSREAAGGGGQQQSGGAQGAARRPCAALSPEDLTESEWFYLMCVSYSFPPGIGLPGKAFARQGHVWLTGANEADSKVFLRAILAKSAGIQTVVCIPLIDGVLELGTTDKVEEDICLVQHARSIFMDHHDTHMMPALSEQSTSSPIIHNQQQPFQIQRHEDTGHINIDPNELLKPGDENNEGDDDEIDAEAASGLGTNTARCSIGNSSLQVPLNVARNEQATGNAGPSELMQIEISEGVRFGSSDGCSNNLDEELQMLVVCQNNDGQSNLQGQDESYQAWQFLQQDLHCGYPQSSAAEDQEMSVENAHYSETISTVLQYNTDRQTDANMSPYLVVSPQSSFSRWGCTGSNLQHMLLDGTPQRMLKTILFSVPTLHCKYKEGLSPKLSYGEGATGYPKVAVQEELSASHVIAERRRREKLNERFIILRSLVPFVTKMDKASILGDTIEYVKQLRKRIQDLESRTRQTEKGAEAQKPASSRSAPNHRAMLSDKRRLRALEGSSSTGNPAMAVDSPSTDVQVSIIERDALLELRCPYSEGLLLQVMQTLQELRLEVTSVQSSSADNLLLAELRAKVKEVRGRRCSITEVKRAIHLILPLD